MYAPHVLPRLAFVRAAQAVGLTLEEIRDLARSAAQIVTRH
jgi:DNA-binding transcriptional MerR regulator